MGDLMHPHNVYAENLPTSPQHQLSVSDVERLAKAGVTMKFEDIARHIVPDPVVPPIAPFDSLRDAADAIYLRYRAALPKDIYGQERRFEGMFQPEFRAARYEDKVYVWVVSGKCEPEMLTDDAAIYPSDALMAKIQLMLKFA